MQNDLRWNKRWSSTWWKTSAATVVACPAYSNPALLVPVQASCMFAWDFAGARIRRWTKPPRVPRPHSCAVSRSVGSGCFCCMPSSGGKNTSTFDRRTKIVWSRFLCLMNMARISLSAFACKCCNPADCWTRPERYAVAPGCPTVQDVLLQCQQFCFTHVFNVSFSMHENLNSRLSKVGPSPGVWSRRCLNIVVRVVLAQRIAVFG